MQKELTPDAIVELIWTTKQRDKDFTLRRNILSVKKVFSHKKAGRSGARYITQLCGNSETGSQETDI